VSIVNYKTSPKRGLGTLNKVVLAYLDGRRLKGHVYDFSASRETFHFFPGEQPDSQTSLEIHSDQLKAVFFVHDFKGNAKRQDRTEALPTGHGRWIKVCFHDGETIVGTTEAFVNSARSGFFLFPADRASNNIRIFVVIKNAREVTHIYIPAQNEALSLSNR